MARYNMDSRMGEVLNDPEAMAILEKYLPKELLHHPLISVAKKHRIQTAYKYHKMADVSTETADKLLAELFQLEEKN